MWLAKGDESGHWSAVASVHQRPKPDGPLGAAYSGNTSVIVGRAVKRLANEIVAVTSHNSFTRLFFERRRPATVRSLVRARIYRKRPRSADRTGNTRTSSSLERWESSSPRSQPVPLVRSRCP